MLRANRIENTGLWFRPAWWRSEPAYRDQRYCTTRDADVAFGALVEVFHARWARSEKGKQHPLRVFSFQGGEWPFINFLSIGRALAEVGRHGVIDKLPERLRAPEEFVGASWELELQAQLIRRGIRIKPWPREKGRRKKNFEWICTYKSQDVNVEVKHLDWDTVVGGVPDGTALDLSILFPPVQKYPLRSVAKKLKDIEGRGPNIMVVFIPVPDDGLGKPLLDLLERDAERFERLSGVFLLNVAVGSKGNILRGLFVRNPFSKVKHLSQDFVDMVFGLFHG